MAEFTIADEDLVGVKGKVVIVTGSSSGIGRATVRLLLSQGALVVGADLAEPTVSGEDEAEDAASPAFTFFKTDVTQWGQQVALFKKTKEIHGRIDHVHANAGVGPRARFVRLELDENGDPVQPSKQALEVNLMSALDTVTLAGHYLSRESGGGSVVITSSTSALQRVQRTDYMVAKHGTVGVLRSMHKLFETEGLPVRVNAVAPSWTSTNMVPGAILTDLKIPGQPASAVARAVVGLMADGCRRGHLIQIDQGTYKEIDEAVLLPAYEALKCEGTLDEDESLERISKEWMARHMRAEEVPHSGVPW